MSNECSYPRCTAISALIYLGRGLCNVHWALLASENPIKEAKARRALKLGEVERETVEQVGFTQKWERARQLIKCSGDAHQAIDIATMVERTRQVSNARPGETAIEYAKRMKRNEASRRSKAKRS